MKQLRRFRVTTLDGTSYVIQAYGVAHAASRATVHLIGRRTSSALIVAATVVRDSEHLNIKDFDASARIAEIRSHYWGVQGAKAPECPPTHPSFQDAH